MEDRFRGNLRRLSDVTDFPPQSIVETKNED
jgi:hypothetical protein